MQADKIKRQGSHTQTRQSPRLTGGLPGASIPNSCLSGLLPGQGESGLDSRTRARETEAFPEVSRLSRGSGRPLQLPEELRHRMESHFGHSLGNLKLRESNDVNLLGAKAYAKGDEIHFAPGQFRPDTTLGRKMIGHEIAHIAQQAAGGMEGEVNLDGGMERLADLHGDAVAGMGEAAAAPTLSPMPAAPFASSPAQGWLLDEHERLTESARKKVLEYTHDHAFDTEPVKKSLQYGAALNDTGHHSKIGFLRHMVWSNDPFIKQTHTGDMQFLHAMDTSQGDTRANVKKMQRYARFTSDVYQNRPMAGGVSFQDMNMLDYIMSQNGADDPLQEMMLSTMLSPDALKQFDEEFARQEAERRPARRERRRSPQKRNADKRARRTQFLREKIQERLAAAGQEYDELDPAMQAEISRDEYTHQDEIFSAYASGSIGNFFTDGNRELDAGMVALGSAAHMLEDSFAGSHAIRSDNLYLGQDPDTELSDDGTDLVEKSTPIMANADYNQQDHFLTAGRHPYGDKFEQRWHYSQSDDQKISNTQGASLARDAAAQFILMNWQMKNAPVDPHDAAYRGSRLERFVNGITAADTKAIAIGGVTATGRAYAKDCTSKEKNKKARKAIKGYRASMDRLLRNERTSASVRADQIQTEVAQLREIFTHGSAKTKAQHMGALKETIVNIKSMLRQILKAPDGALTDEDRAAEEQLKAFQRTLEALLRRNGG